MKNYDNVIPIFFALDSQYVPLATVTITSLIENSSENLDYRIYIIYSNISRDEQDVISSLATKNVSISFICVSESLKRFENLLFTRDYYSNATYYRFLIPELFPQYDKGIYLDSDIILTRDISELFSVELNNNYLAAITDDVITEIQIFSEYSEDFLKIPKKQYFNAGVLLMNLQEMRRVSFLNKVISLMKKVKFRVAQDQDYLNVICKNKVVYLDALWNVTPLENKDKSKTPYIIHFKINFKPWRYKGIPFEDEFWKYAKKTPYYDYLKNILENYSQEEKQRDALQYEHLVSLAKKETEKIYE